MLKSMANPEHIEILQQGASKWNKWRKERSTSISGRLGSADIVGYKLGDADLSNTDLRGLNIQGADLSFSNLKEVDLSNANLKGANLVNADLFSSNLSSVDFSGANLSFSNLNFTNLSNANLKGANLRLAKFHDVCLKGACLKGINLSQVQLGYADLSGFDFSNADFTCAQALATNFRGAVFTGACIEDWHVNSDTNLTEIICDYVYQKKDRQERRPSSGNFQSGDFTRLYQKAIETLDLIFQDGIDWKSFEVTLKELNTDRKLNIEDENSQLTVRAIEKRDDGSFVIRVDVPISIDKAELDSSFKNKYKKQLQAQAEQYRQQLQAKDLDIEHYRQQNTNLTEAIVTLASKPIKIENVFMPTNESKGNTYKQSNMGIGHVSGGDFKDNKIAGTINESAHPSLADAAAEIRDLLIELEKSYPSNTTTEKMVIATKAIERIEADPAWQKRTVSALKSGSISALEKAIDNPVGAFLKGAFEGWENAE
jgi:uncharacterized protein YjbI with pentapeptide repeats